MNALSASRGAAGDSRLLRRWVLAAGASLIALIVTADSYEAWLDYREARAMADRSEAMAARAIAQHIGRALDEIELIVDAQAPFDAMPANSTDAMNDRLRNDLLQLPFVKSLSFVSPEGQELAHAGEGLSSAAISIAESHAALEEESFEPFTVGLANKTGLLVIRPLQDDQHPVGNLVARVTLDSLIGDSADLGITDTAHIQLLRAGGEPLASVGADLVSANDATLRARVPLSHHPLLVEVSEPLDAVMAAWRAQELSSAWRTAVLVLLAGGLLMALSTALKRRDRLEQERLRLERGLRETQRADAVGFLAASMAHDFNNVLSAIVGYAEIARAQVGEALPVARTLDGLLTASDRARQLVQRVLTFDPRRNVSRERIDIRPIAIEVLDQLSPGLPRGIELRFDSQHSEGMVHGDATEMHQIIMNLCTNAIRAMQSGGRLWLRIEDENIQHAQSLMIGELRPGRCVRLEISDTGIGISREQLSTIFDSFYTTRDSDEAGGIGLTVVRNIVIDMQGALDIQSEPGVGTTVRVYWPAADAATLASGPTMTAVRGQGQSILVVDDEPELVRVAEEMVAALGYEAIGFQDSSSALDTFRAEPNRFDAVITDERMPIMRGTALAQAIHSMRPELPVLLVTGFRDQNVNERARNAGIDVILDKPLRAKNLHAALSRVLARSH